MKRNIGKIIVFLAIFSILFYYVGNILQPEYYYDAAAGDGAGYEDKYHAFYQEPDNSLDVIFLGPSTALSSFLPMELYKQQGITSFSLASGGQYMPTSYYLLKSAIRCQKPKLVVLDISALAASDGFYKTISENNYKVIEEIQELPIRYEAIRAARFADIDMAEWLMPTFKFHSRWKKITEAEWKREERLVQYPCFYKGSFLDVHINPWYQKRTASLMVEAEASPDYVSQYHDDMNQEVTELQAYYSSQINEHQEIYFEKLLTLCQENDMELVCVKGPTAVSWSQEKHDNVETFLKQFGLKLMDFNYGAYKLDIDWQTDTSDNGLHVNYFGALKATGHLIDYLQQYDQLPDHRGDENYAGWETALAEYEEAIAEKLSTDNERALRWLAKLNENKDGKVILIAVRDDVSFGFNEDYQKQMEALGIQTDLYHNQKNSFLALIDDGKVVYEKKDNKILLYKDVIYDAAGKAHKVELRSSGMAQGDVCYVKLDGTNYERNGQGFNIVVYDKEQSCVTESVSIHLYKNGIFKEKELP